MSKLIITYSIFSVLLFGALFAAFFVSGLGEPSEDWFAAPAQDSGDSAAADAVAPSALENDLDYPDLEFGRTYRVSHQTKMYTAPDPETADMELLPERGYMTVIGTEDVDTSLWYAVSVSDGAREYARYVLAMDLNFKRVIPQYSDDEIEDQKMAAAIQQASEWGAQRRAERLAAMPPPEPEERVPETFDEWWSMTAARMGGAQPATIIASAMAAAIGTVLCIGSMFVLTSLRREHTWSRTAPADLDAEWDEARRDEDDDADAYGERPSGTDDRW